jgi:hypothetical protein
MLQRLARDAQVVHEAEHAIEPADVIARHVRGVDRYAQPRFGDFDLTQTIQPLREVRREPRRQMLNDQRGR